MKLLFDESLSPKLVSLLSDLFPDSESALRNRLSGCRDLNILKYASDGGYVLVSTDSDFGQLLDKVEDPKIVILRSCNYPTQVGGEVLRKNAIRITELSRSTRRIIVLDR